MASTISSAAAPTSSRSSAFARCIPHWASRSGYGLTITEDVAREDISDHVDRVATMMRVGQQAAKFYVTDEVIAASPLISPPRLVRTTS